MTGSLLYLIMDWESETSISCSRKMIYSAGQYNDDARIDFNVFRYIYY